ncbi:MAG: triose-phosphate isomerase [Candidatus Paceibacterota bacterium]|jgi:triosephosphate isomerase
MKIKKLLIVGNWKMYVSTFNEARSIAQEVSLKIKGNKVHSVVLCPSFSHLFRLSGGKKGLITWGAQDVGVHEEGAHTGETGARQLADSGISYVIVGHSERRAGGETNEVISEKVKRARAYGIVPIVCIGESVRDEHGDYLRVVREQIMQSLRGIKKADLKNIVIAYEPVWSIGKKEDEIITPRDLHEMVIYIRKILSLIFGANEAKAVRIIYGGSVTPGNAYSIVNLGEVAGLLIGRDSVRPDSLASIVKILS